MKKQIAILFGLLLLVLIFVLISINTKRPIMMIPALIIGISAISGIFYVPNDPPHIGILIVLGKRLNISISEGFNFIFLRGIIFDVKLINITKRNIDFVGQVLTTPDNATTKVNSSISYTPDKENIITFLNMGGDEGIKHMLTDIEEEKLRIWARSKNEGPQTWEQLNDSAEEAIKIIISEICGQNLSDQDINKIHKGNGKWKIPHLGIILNRYNLSEMKTFGNVYEASIKLDEEKKQRKSESYEVITDLNKAKILQKEYKKKGVNKSLDETMEKTMSWKIEREANSQMSISSIAKILGTLKGGKS